MRARSPGFVVRAKPPQARRGQRAVLVDERDDVRDRRERDEVEVLGQRLRPEQCLAEPEHDAGAAQLGERILRRAGYDERAVRQPLARPVVVGDDDLEPERLRLGDLVDGGDPAIDGEDETALLARQPRERLQRDAVALLEAARQVPLDLGAELAEDEHGERGRADPVGVVVPVDADPLACRDRAPDRVAGSLHVAEEERIVRRPLAREERPRGGGVAVAPPDEHARGRLARCRAPARARRPPGGGTDEASRCPPAWQSR